MKTPVRTQINSASDPASAFLKPVKPPRRRIGKIARLPAKDREKINVMLRDGFSYPAIVKNLRQQKRPELHQISEQNISKWKNGGYQDWLASQQFRDDIEQLHNEAIDFAGADGEAGLEQAILRLASLRLFEFYKQLNPQTLAAAVSANPGSLTRLFTSLPRITRESLRLQKYRDYRDESLGLDRMVKSSCKLIEADGDRILRKLEGLAVAILMGDKATLQKLARDYRSRPDASPPGGSPVPPAAASGVQPQEKEKTSQFDHNHIKPSGHEHSNRTENRIEECQKPG